MLTVDFIVSPSVGSNFSLNFVVITSDSTARCAPISDSVKAAFTTSCAMPQNNDCANGITLNISMAGGRPVAFSTTNATYSGGIPLCDIADYLDLFYTFNAPKDTVTMEIPGISGNIGFYGLFDACPGSGIEVECGRMLVFSGATYIFTNLIIGKDYFLQILFIPGAAETDQEICLQSTIGQTALSCPSSTDVSDVGTNLPNQS